MAQVSSAGLLWGIRAGFRDYFDALEDARLEFDAVERTPTGFYFPARPSGGFSGGLRFTAHGGALDVRFADPSLEQTTDGVLLTADLGEGRRAVARLLDAASASTLAAHGGVAEDVALTMDGSTWLGGVYAPWARMDAVHVLRSHSTPSPGAVD